MYTYDWEMMSQGMLLLNKGHWIERRFLYSHREKTGREDKPANEYVKTVPQIAHGVNYTNIHSQPQPDF